MRRSSAGCETKSVFSSTSWASPFPRLVSYATASLSRSLLARNSLVFLTQQFTQQWEPEVVGALAVTCCHPRERCRCPG